MTNGNQEEITPEQRQAWLIEYQVCQQDSSSMISTHWTVVGIIMGFITLALGWVLANLDNNCAWLLTGLGIFIIAIMIFLCLWLDRVNFLIELNKRRLRTIEPLLEIQKERFTEEMDNRRPRFFGIQYPLSGRCIIKTIYCIYGLVGVALVFYACFAY